MRVLAPLNGPTWNGCVHTCGRTSRQLPGELATPGGSADMPGLVPIPLSSLQLAAAPRLAHCVEAATVDLRGEAMNVTGTAYRY